MTKEEFREVDKKVAVELGWTDISEDEAVHHFQGFFDVVGTHPDGDILPVPRYSTCAQSADLVRIEIERRGWEWLFENRYLNDGTMHYEATVTHPQWPESRGVGIFPDIDCVSKDSPHVALCLAYLKACEATREEQL